jgi:hypothetical protein
MIYLSSRNPDISKCRASHSGEGGLIFCLNEERYLCDYCLPFGEAYYCRHPKCHEIAEHTTESREKQQTVQMLPTGLGLSGV